ncbi:hypothetical protein Tco_0580184 [Tanacetum coccineum]
MEMINDNRSGRKWKPLVTITGWKFNVRIYRGARRDEPVARVVPTRSFSIVNHTTLVGFPDNIQGNVTSSKPVRLQDAIRMGNGLMDQKVHVYAARNAEKKRMFDNNPRGNRIQQPPFKRQNVAQAIIVGNNEKRGYAGSALYCNKCRLYHEGPCTVKCTSCKKVGHMAKDRIRLQLNDARGRAYALGGGDGNPYSNVITAEGEYISESGHYFFGALYIDFLDHFLTDLMPVELGSFDVIIEMDWLSKYHVVIVCDEKIVRIPYGNEILRFEATEAARDKRGKNKSEESTEGVRSFRIFQKSFLEHLSRLPQLDKSIFKST